jgi:hypothetical protein
LAGLKPQSSQSLLPKSWDYRCDPPSPKLENIFIFKDTFKALSVHINTEQALGLTPPLKRGRGELCRTPAASSLLCVLLSKSVGSKKPSHSSVPVGRWFQNPNP